MFSVLSLREAVPELLSFSHCLHIIKTQCPVKEALFSVPSSSVSNDKEAPAEEEEALPSSSVPNGKEAPDGDGSVGLFIPPTSPKG